MINVQANDIGVEFIVQILEEGQILDLSDATSMYIVFKKPSGQSSTYAASLYSDGTDGKIKYISVDGDLSEIGRYKIQGYVHFGDSLFHTSTDTFKVLANLT